MVCISIFYLELGGREASKLEFACNIPASVSCPSRRKSGLGSVLYELIARFHCLTSSHSRVSNAAYPHIS